ncbi:MAG: amidohydrolase family protein [Lentisphaerae bacterium]|nr:amidohydrolase family protein [Lentisphaerota bacterium]
MSYFIDRNSDLWRRIHDETCRTRVIDCHWHTILEPEYEQTEKKPGLFDMCGYFARDIGGLKERGVISHVDCQTDEERWLALREDIRRSGNVTYYRHMWHTLRVLFDLGEEELNDNNWRAIHEKIRESSKQPGRFRTLIRDIAGIDLGIHNVFLFEGEVESGHVPGLMMRRKPLDEYRLSSVGVVALVQIGDPQTIRRLERETDVDVRDAKSLSAALRRLLQIIKSEGAPAIKSQHAYGRTLLHERVTPAAATKALGKLMGEGKPTPTELKRLQDFIFWRIAEYAGEVGLVFQIHTGIQTNWCHMPDSDPRHLLEPIGALRETKFDLFHAGYPFTIELGLMAKHHSNVWPNMAWMYVITMEGSRRTLDEWIDLVPGDRILGFGSDVGWPELVVSHLSMARLCIADVLTKKVTLDLLTEEVAMRLVRQILRENAIELYGLDL